MCAESKSRVQRWFHGTSQVCLLVQMSGEPQSPWARHSSRPVHDDNVAMTTASAMPFISRNVLHGGTWAFSVVGTDDGQRVLVEREILLGHALNVLRGHAHDRIAVARVLLVTEPVHLVERDRCGPRTHL